ncbi:MAG TPA: glyceraldehyde 3-phosphate dehydrogenase NAD-binding domain-containing protein, partial [Gemmatimonadales bacterium]|nr:glyceraldehyde 3-phosphate dehydrogenase NAD-binding domain-containing protein [Gemmatimonadales bacterium]
MRSYTIFQMAGDTMAVRVAINGFGRIGRNVLRGIVKSGAALDVVAVNDITAPETLGHLLKYDSVHGRFPGTVSVEGNTLHVNDKKIAVLAERDPGKLPWKDLKVDIVLESTGLFRKREQAAAH